MTAPQGLRGIVVGLLSGVIGVELYATGRLPLWAAVLVSIAIMGVILYLLMRPWRRNSNG